VIGDLRQNKVNFVSFTPDTSFRISETGGNAEERIVLQRMLSKAWGKDVVRSKGWIKFFQGGKDPQRYEASLKSYDGSDIDEDIAIKFAQDVESATAYNDEPLTDVLWDCVDRFRPLRRKPEHQLSRHRYRLIGQMRNLVARAAVDTLEPDLVILDEFQRFKGLLDPEQPGADLAHSIFDQPMARVLLLSATPYKMYTLPDEQEGDDHYADFRRTIEFLGGAERAAGITRDLRTIRETLLGSGDIVVAEEAKKRVETDLRRVMSRTERLAATPDRDGMLKDASLGRMQIEASDVLAYRSAAAIAQCVDRQDVFEYWRSSPYIFNIMEGYQVKKRLRDSLSKANGELREALSHAAGMLDWETLRNYSTLDPGNAKMRALVEDVLDRGTWRLMWLPPSLPYYTPHAAYAEHGLQQFTKRLIFSAWAVVPKAISLVLSYEAERRAQEGTSATSRKYDDDRPTGLLRFQVESRGPAGMPVLAILYPSWSLARLGDPLVAARRVTDSLPADRDKVLGDIRQQVVTALAVLPAPAATDGPADQRWYWAAPFLLDRELGDQQEDFLEEMSAWGNSDNDDAQSRLNDHVVEARALDASSLGRRPDDLVDVVTLMALAAPGPVALRALARVCGGSAVYTDPTIRNRAADVSWALRSLFNTPEAMAVVRQAEGTEPYWRAVLAHALDGNLQATLDEYVHVLVESEGLQDRGAADRADEISQVIEEATTLRATRVSVDDITLATGKPRVETHNGRVHFAARFGRGVTEDATAQREGQVRQAFNSPFWPFVLASTSVGQEGLDFHQYSHAVVHWNLPSNPVDLEQREGRVHRYKGHAIRRNIAANFADAAWHATVDDPWYAMFLAAVDARTEPDDLTPFWVYAPEGGAKIERYVPATPLSKETARYARLLRTVGAYRMVIGQPRQEDLLRYLGSEATRLSKLRIDLSPRI
jgi:hypothetical protein